MTAMKEKEKEKLEVDVSANVTLLEEEVKKDPYAPPDGGWGWVVMISAFLCCLVLDGTCYVFGVFMKPMMEDLEVDNATMSAVGSVLSGVIQLVGPFVALLVNVLGMRIVCIVGAVVSAAGFFFSTFVTDIYLLMVLFGIVAGTGLGLMYVPAVVSVGYYFDKKRALATGIVCSGSGAGTFILAPLASFLLSALGGWRGAMKVFGGLCLFCVLCGLSFRPLPKKPSKKEANDDAEGQDEDETKPNCLRTIINESCNPRLLTNAPFMLLCFSNLFATQGLYIPYVFLPKLAIERGVSDVNAAFLISIVGICNTIGRILSGMLTDLPGVSAMVVTFIGLGNTHIFISLINQFQYFQVSEAWLPCVCHSATSTGPSSSSPSCSEPSCPPGAPSRHQLLSRSVSWSFSLLDLEHSPLSEDLLPSSVEITCEFKSS